MSYKKLKDILKATMYEGLNKNEYNKILDGLNLGVEIEIIAPDRFHGYEEDVHIDIDFNEAGSAFNDLTDCIEDTDRSMDNLDEYVMDLIPAFNNIYLKKPRSS